MATIFNRFSSERKAFINPGDVTERISGFPKVCITTFSESIIEGFVKENGAKVIAGLFSRRPSPASAVPCLVCGHILRRSA